MARTCDGSIEPITGSGTGAIEALECCEGHDGPGSEPGDPVDPNPVLPAEILFLLENQVTVGAEAGHAGGWGGSPNIPAETGTAGGGPPGHGGPSSTEPGGIAVAVTAT